MRVFQLWSYGEPFKHILKICLLYRKFVVLFSFRWFLLWFDVIPRIPVGSSISTISAELINSWEKLSPPCFGIRWDDISIFSSDLSRLAIWPAEKNSEEGNNYSKVTARNKVSFLWQIACIAHRIWDDHQWQRERKRNLCPDLLVNRTSLFHELRFLVMQEPSTCHHVQH